jgi:hypothetical protein
MPGSSPASVSYGLYTSVKLSEDAQASDDSPWTLLGHGVSRSEKREFHGGYILRGTPKNPVRLRVTQTEGGHGS